MKVKRENLSILFDGLLKGGAETLVLAMLPFFKKKFKKIEIYFMIGVNLFLQIFKNMLHCIQFLFGKYCRWFLTKKGHFFMSTWQNHFLL